MLPRPRVFAALAQGVVAALAFVYISWTLAGLAAWRSAAAALERAGSPQRWTLQLRICGRWTRAETAGAVAWRRELRAHIELTHDTFVCTQRGQTQSSQAVLYKATSIKCEVDTDRAASVDSTDVSRHATAASRVLRSGGSPHGILPRVRDVITILETCWTVRHPESPVSCWPWQNRPRGGGVAANRRSPPEANIARHPPCT